jgi:hypothetical protein
MISFTLAIEALEGHGPGIGEARHLSQGRQDLVRDRLIYRYRHRGGGAGGGAPDGHVADVDPVLAQDVPILPIMPGISSLRMKSVYFCGTMSTVKPKASIIRGCIRGPSKVPLTMLSPPSPAPNRKVTRLV